MKPLFAGNDQAWAEIQSVETSTTAGMDGGFETWLGPEDGSSFAPVYGVPRFQPVAAPAKSTPVNSPASSEVSKETRESVEAFLVEHHARSSRRDALAMFDNYAERVEYMNHGLVGRNFVFKDLSEYHAQAQSITDTIISTPTIRPESNGNVHTDYLLKFRRVLPNGRWNQGVAEFSLNLEMTADGWKISEQHVKIREQEKGP